VELQTPQLYRISQVPMISLVNGKVWNGLNVIKTVEVVDTRERVLGGAGVSLLLFERSQITGAQKKWSGTHPWKGFMSARKDSSLEEHSRISRPVSLRKGQVAARRGFVEKRENIENRFNMRITDDKNSFLGGKVKGRENCRQRTGESSSHSRRERRSRVGFKVKE